MWRFFLLVAAVQLGLAAFGDPDVLRKIAARPSRCSPTCIQYGTCNEELARCDCPKHRKGLHCEQEAPLNELEALCPRLGHGSVAVCMAQHNQPCINGCNSRGTCVQGFCHCEPGHYGTDCSLSLDDQGQPHILQGTSYTTRAKRPWIYVYQLPPFFNAWRQRNRIDRPTFFYFWERFLSSGALTADASKADFFFVPVYLRFPGSAGVLMSALQHIRETWPYFNRPGMMQRHMVIHGGDWGKQEGRFVDVLPGMEQGIRDGITWLTHWGIFKPVYMPLPGLKDKHPHWEAAHNPGKDVVVPVPAAGVAFKHDNSSLHPNAWHRQRDVIFSHAGRICGDTSLDPSKPWPENCSPRGRRYSSTVRQKVHAYHHNRTGYSILLRVRSAGELMAQSKFCLATQGGGHGNRQVLAAVAGCLPVVIGDNIYQPFEPEMDYNQFGVRLPEDQIPVMHEVLASVDDEAYRRKQAALRCAAQHLLFSSMRGSFIGETGRYDSFETMLEILRAHIDNPGVPPEDLKKVDPAFRRFMACGAEEMGQEPVTPEPLEPRVCSRSKLDSPDRQCDQCAHKNMIEGPHTLCCNSLDLAACPRLWS